MPCDSIQTVTISWTEKTDTKLLGKAFEALGYKLHTGIASTTGLTATNSSGHTISYDGLTKRISLSGRYGVRLDEAQVKKAYAKEVVNHTARVQGWKIQWDGDEFEMTRARR